jgi:hypothetical protein
MRLDTEAGPQRVHGGVGLNFGGVKVQLIAPDQPCRSALLDDGLEEATEDVQRVPLADARHTEMIRQRFRYRVAQLDWLGERAGQSRESAG